MDGPPRARAGLSDELFAFACDEADRNWPRPWLSYSSVPLPVKPILLGLV